MKVLEFLHKNSIIADLASQGKNEVIAEMAAHIAREEKSGPDEVLKVLMDRERLGSTGIGDGIAIPHGTMSSLNHLVALFARSLNGVEFDAIDGKKTHLFFVILTPDNNVGLQALARVSRMMREPRFREALMSAADHEALYQTIKREDERL